MLTELQNSVGAGELERVLAACMAKLRNAEDYPNECGLTREQRDEQLGLIATIERQIAETKADMAAA